MSSRRSRAGAVCGLAATALLFAPGPAQAARGPHHPKPRPGQQVPVLILGINDFHGAIEAPSGSGGRVTNADGSSTDAGGAEYLSTHLKNARDRFTAKTGKGAKGKGAKGNGVSLTVSAGDNIGGTPFLSQAFYDEPTIETLNHLGVTASAVGNHELDHGWGELHRMADGGCLPAEPGSAKVSCALHPYTGAKFDYLAANIKDSAGNEFAPYTIRRVNGVQVAFIGLTLKSTLDIVSAAGIKTLTVGDEVAAGNRTAAMLKRRGVNAMVALVHQGGSSPVADWNYRCGNGSTISGDILPIAKGLSSDIDMIFSAHSHQAYVCDIPDPAGRPRQVTQGANGGRLFTEFTGMYDTRTRDFVRPTVSATNHVVTRDVAKDAKITALIAGYKERVGPIASAKVADITADIVADRNSTGSTALGNLIADAQLTDPSVANGATPQIAFMNPGGIRADLTHKASMGEGDGVVTYQEAFSVQPFGNYVVSMSLTGKQIYDLLGEQWSGSYPKILQVSKGFTYAYTVDPAGKGTIVPGSVKLNGTPIEQGTTYRVVVNSFLSDGGDGFTTFKNAGDKYQGGLDIDALTRYLGANTPYSPVGEQRIVRR